MDVLQSILLGLVQGLTEFIPVSSSAHLRIVPALLGWPDPGAAFSAVLQLGTLAAVLVFFSRDVWRLSVAALRSLVSAEARQAPDARLAWAIALGTVPIVVLGLSLQHWIETTFRALPVIAFMLAAVALALMGVEHRDQRRGEGTLDAHGLGWRRVLMIGCFQALALIPGTSRSGATILGGLLLGMRRAEAARFSFLLGIPAILGSGLYELPVVLEGVSRGDVSLAALGGGLAAAALSGYGAIAFLLRFLQTHTTLVFSLYRLALAAYLVGFILL